MYRSLLPLFLLSCVYGLSASAQPGKWISLFNGKDLSGWKQLAGKADYRVEDGAIVGRTVPHTPNSFLVTKKEYGNFVLELEVKIEDTSSNSGVQFRSHYDPAGYDGKGKVFGYQYELDPSARRWTAGIYDEARRGWLYPLTLNPVAQPIFKVNEFIQVKIECVGDELRTWINGIPAAYLVDAADSRGFIALQVHQIDKPELAGEKIYWKNIRIKPLAVLTDDFPKDGYVVSTVPNRLASAEKKNGWKLLFDGSSAKGWRSATKDEFPEKGWTIKDGAITIAGSPDKESATAGDIVTTEQYKSFDLSFDFRMTDRANSGVKYFVNLNQGSNGGAIGLEYQVLDDLLHPDAKEGRDGDRTLASLYDLIPAAKPAGIIKPIGEWNTGRIVVYPNNHVVHYLNGTKVLEYDRGSVRFRGLVAMSKYKIYPNFGESKQGYILLQDHGAEVSYRSIKIREL